MPEPSKIEFDLGSNAHQQPIRLIVSSGASSLGRATWTLVQDQADQRDDSASICGLTHEQLRKIAEIAKDYAK